MGDTRIIWIVWLQGWQQAPTLCHHCLASWRHWNPGWEVRPLDLAAIRGLLALPDLQGKVITAASFTDLVRVQLLHDFGGVWVDATVLCHQPLDGWLQPLLDQGFFAFQRPAPDRWLASWFLAARGAGHPLLSHWCQAALSYWQQRDRAHQYFWFHDLFRQICMADPQLAACWHRVPCRSADGPHRAQQLGLASEDPAALAEIQGESAPVLKLTHRHDPALLGRSCLLSWLLRPYPPAVEPQPVAPAEAPLAGVPMAGLSVASVNLGDHIQILGARQWLRRHWGLPLLAVDRDDGLASLPGLPPLTDGRRYPILLNGWFKHNASEWPPHPSLWPAYVGFHLRPFQCPALVAGPALAHYREHGPIGCRDVWTMELLQAHGVEAYLSHCLSLTLPQRLPAAAAPMETMVVSRDRQILAYLPPQLGPYTFITHYAESRDFDVNMAASMRLLDLYRNRAARIITTLLHCALPAMAMGIPVIMVWPVNPPAGRDSDRQRFSSLSTMLPIHEPEQLAGLDPALVPLPVPVAAAKLRALDSLRLATRCWGLPPQPLPWHLAHAAALPPPG
ncbi:MAG: capsular polysaccharide synthesis protein [Cyanobacteriota bacterium]|nr:capsular polysaccharide synthesis protein [Cyanobacteriota bacterium]